MKTRVLAGVMSILTLGMLLAGCGGQKEAPQETQEAVVTEAAALPETTAATEVQETVPPNCVIVSTPYGNLQYQDQWHEFMYVEQVQDGENIVVTFSAKFENGQYPLFALTIGSLGEEPATYITDAAGVQRGVYVRMMEIVESDALSDAEQNRVYAMQEDINYVMENIK